MTHQPSIVVTSVTMTQVEWERQLRSVQRRQYREERKQINNLMRCYRAGLA